MKRASIFDKGEYAMTALEDTTYDLPGAIHGNDSSPERPMILTSKSIGLPMIKMLFKMFATMKSPNGKGSAVKRVNSRANAIHNKKISLIMRILIYPLNT